MEIISSRSLIIKLHNQGRFPENELRYRTNIEKIAKLLNFERIMPFGDITDRNLPLKIEFKNGMIADIKIDTLGIENRKIIYVVNDSTELVEKEITPIIESYLQSLLKKIELQIVITTYQTGIKSKLNIDLNNIFNNKLINFIKTVEDTSKDIYSVLFSLFSFKFTYNTPSDVSQESIYLSKKEFKLIKLESKDKDDKLFETEMPFETEKHIKFLEAFEISLK